MIKFIFFVFFELFSSYALASNTLYYWQNPPALIQSLGVCPNVTDAELSCADLAKLKASFDAMAYDLQTDPQIFGKVILKLQEDIATQEQTIANHPDDEVLKTQLIKSKEELAQRLAVVKWFESPES